MIVDTSVMGRIAVTVLVEMMKTLKSQELPPPDIENVLQATTTHIPGMM